MKYEVGCWYEDERSNVDELDRPRFRFKILAMRKDEEGTVWTFERTNQPMYLCELKGKCKLWTDYKEKYKCDKDETYYSCSAHKETNVKIRKLSKIESLLMDWRFR